MLSLSLDFSGLYAFVNNIVNGLFPIYLVPIGIMLGIGLIGLIAKGFDTMVNHYQK